MDISKLKVPDLKKELRTRGLNVSGNKNELIERLQAAMSKPTESLGGNESVDELDEDLLNEEDDDVPLETPESVISDLDTALSDTSSQQGQKRKIITETIHIEPKTTKIVLNRNIPVISPAEEDDDKSAAAADKKVLKISAVSTKERLEMRAKKFDVTLNTDVRKLARAERFGISNVSPAVNSTNGSSKIEKNVTTSVEVLKQRAERFGGSVSGVISSLEVQDKLEKRKARFGIVTPDDKAKQRLERFKQPIK